MKVSIKVKLNSRVESVEKLQDGTLLVRINAPPTEGKANKRIIELLSDYFCVPKSALELAHGHRSKTKVVEIKI